MHRASAPWYQWNAPRGFQQYSDDFPHVAPFLAIENFVSYPVHTPTFCFSKKAAANIMCMNEMKVLLTRLDDFIERNNLHHHPCLISQAGAQSTMRLASKVMLPGYWNSAVEMPFCLHITENGYCPRVFDIDDLQMQVQWVAIFEKVLLPLDKMDERKLAIIAPHQHSDIVKHALMKSKREKNKKLYKQNNATKFWNNGRSHS